MIFTVCRCYTSNNLLVFTADISRDSFEARSSASSSLILALRSSGTRTSDVQESSEEDCGYRSCVRSANGSPPCTVPGRRNEVFRDLMRERNPWFSEVTQHHDHKQRVVRCRGHQVAMVFNAGSYALHQPSTVRFLILRSCTAHHRFTNVHFFPLILAFRLATSRHEQSIFWPVWCFYLPMRQSSNQFRRCRVLKSANAC